MDFAVIDKRTVEKKMKAGKCNESEFFCAGSWHDTMGKDTNSGRFDTMGIASKQVGNKKSGGKTWGKKIQARAHNGYGKAYIYVQYDTEDLMNWLILTSPFASNGVEKMSPEKETVWAADIFLKSL